MPHHSHRLLAVHEGGGEEASRAEVRENRTGKRKETSGRVMAESLKHFVLRSEARKLFRSFAKTARRLPTRCVCVCARVRALVRQVHVSM